MSYLKINENDIVKRLLLCYTIIENDFVRSKDMLKQYITSKYDGLKHSLTSSKPSKIDLTMKVDPSKKYQEIIGFGGAFTESACYTLSQMSQAKREEVLKAYFDQEDGLAYNIGRVHIHSCDFSLENYTYVDENDKDLKTFDLSREFKWVIPTIKRAEEIRGSKISLLASPWSPPAWMKSNKDMNHGGSLLDEYKQSWANYYIKYLEHAKKAGLDVFAMTVQNEPAAVQTWDSCVYTAEEERDFVRDYLGPTLEKSPYKDTKLIIWDHNRDIIVDRAKTVLEDELTSPYVWGTGIHWYVSEEFEHVGKVHELFPDKHLLFTEGCIEGGVHLNVYETGERYARNIIGDFSNWCEGFLDWNLTLNEIGGPNHVGNYCDAPIISDTKTNELHYNNSYYYLGHFSKHIKAGAKRIDTSIDHEDLKVISFENPDQSIVSIVLNQSEEDYGIALELGQKKEEVLSKKRSILTIVQRGEQVE